MTTCHLTRSVLILVPRAKRRILNVRSKAIHSVIGLFSFVFFALLLRGFIQVDAPRQQTRFGVIQVLINAEAEVADLARQELPSLRFGRFPKCKPRIKTGSSPQWIVDAAFLVEPILIISAPAKNVFERIRLPHSECFSPATLPRASPCRV